MGALNRVLVLALWVCSAQLIASERYLRAAVDADGVLRIDTDAGRSIVTEPEPDLAEIGSAIGLHQIRIAPDRRAVGWLVKYPNCCTSYPIPLTLVVYSGGVRRSYRGSGLPIWQWSFLEGGSQVAFRQEAVHSRIGTRFELRDVRSGDQIDAFDWPVGPDNQPVVETVLPSWAQSTVMNVPEAFIGRWDTTHSPCKDFATEGMLEITARSVALYAAGGPIRAVQSNAEDALTLLVTFYQEDGTERSDWMHLRMSKDGNRLQRDDFDTEYFRCRGP